MLFNKKNTGTEGKMDIDLHKNEKTAPDTTNIAKRSITEMILDASGSVKPYKSLIESALLTIISTLKNDPYAEQSSEIGLITFNTTAQEVYPIKELYNQPQETFALNAEGLTNTGEAVLMALDRIDQRKAELRKEGISVYKPQILAIVTDGSPYFGSKDNTTPEFKKQCADQLEKAYDEISRRVNAGELRVLALGVGDDADDEILDKLSGGMGGLHIDSGLDLAAFFKVVSDTISSQSRGKKLPTNEEALRKMTPAQRRAFRNSKED